MPLAKDQATDVLNGLLGASGDSPLLMRKLVEENLDLYKQAVKGNWSPYGWELAKIVIPKIGEHFGLGPWVDAIVGLAKKTFESDTVNDLKQKAQEIDSIGERLQHVQTLIADAQKALLTTSKSPRPTTPTPPHPPPPPPPPPRRTDYSELDDAILVKRWRDLGNHAFSNKAEEDAFYRRHPAYLKYRRIAELRSSADDVDSDLAQAARDNAKPKDAAQTIWDPEATTTRTSECQMKAQEWFKRSTVNCYPKTVNGKPYYPMDLVMFGNSTAACLASYERNKPSIKACEAGLELNRTVKTPQTAPTTPEKK